jgi:hypothetical protein
MAIAAGPKRAAYQWRLAIARALKRLGARYRQPPMLALAG